MPACAPTAASPTATPPQPVPPNAPTTEIQFLTQVDAKTAIKYVVSSSALNSKTAPWECSANATLCKAVLPLVIPTYTTRVFVPDGFTKMSLQASLGGFNDGKSKGRSMRILVDSFVMVNNTK